MHNGQIGSDCAIKRRLDAMIPDDLYPLRAGTTDSEALFLAAFAFGLDTDPVGALIRLLHAVHAMMVEAGIVEPFTRDQALTDGRDLFAVRWASDSRAPTLYYRQTRGELVVVSEPFDGERARWREVSQNCVLRACGDAPPTITPLAEDNRQAA